MSSKRTKDNYVVGFAMLRDTYYYNYNLEHQSKLLFSMVDVVLHSGPPDGLIFIINMKGVTTYRHSSMQSKIFTLS